MQNDNPFTLTHLFPHLMRDSAFEMSSNIQAPPALIASSILAAVSIVCQGLVDVRRPNGLESPCSLFLITIADSGERKTTCDNFFTKPIREFDTNADSEFLVAKAGYEADLIAWESTHKALLAQIYNVAKKESENVN
ncbi:MAG: DUF3987 domain-containing protein [Candidatus Saccharibacteria bacterium]|nr:DUF3987 domain-containing protein [Moraxellaceae bacterium]